MGGVVASGIGDGKRGFGNGTGGQGFAGVGAEQAGVLPRQAEPVKQRLKSGNAGMIHNSVIGVGHAGKRTAEPMVQRISRGQYHDMPPDPAQGEGVRRILTAFAPMIRVKRASTGHAASSAREPYTTSARPISPSVSASFGKPMPQDTTSMRPASVSIPLPSIAFNPFCRPENTSGRSFRCIQVPRAPRSCRWSFWGRSGGMGGVALSRKIFSVFLRFLLLTPFFLK